MALLVLVLAIIFGFIGSAMATSRQTSGIGGFVLGFFLGAIGLVIIAMTPVPKASVS